MDKFINQKRIIIPKGASKVEFSYKISTTIGLKMDTDPKYSITRAQEVSFYENTDGGTLNILCIKNCLPKAKTTRPSMALVLKAVLKGWTLSNGVYLLWSCTDITDEDEKEISYDTLKSRKGDEFYLNPVALEKERRYLAKVSVVGGPKDGMSAEFDFATDLPPMPFCQLIPLKGVALQTYFSIECIDLNHNLFIEVFSVRKSQKTSLVLRSNTLTKNFFYLPAGSDVLINITYLEYDYTASLYLRANVSDGLDLEGKSEKQISETVTSKLDTAMDLIKSGNTGLPLQELMVIVSEYSKSLHVTKSVKAELDKKVVSALKTIDLDTGDTAQKVIDILALIDERYEKANPDLITMSLEICMKAQSVLFNEVEYAQNLQPLRRQIENIIKSISSCSQVGLKENPESVRTENLNITIPPIEVPPLPILVPPEDYPDYVDDELSSDNIAKLEIATQNMGKICFSNAEMMVFTMVPEEDPVVTKEGLMDIVAGRMYCYEVPYRKMNIRQNYSLWVQPSRECFQKKISVVDTLLCTIHENPYWYIDNITLITPVIFLKFLGRGFLRSTESTDLNSNVFTVNLPINTSISLKEEVHQAEMPDKPISSLDEESFYDYVSVHRIFVAANQRFIISFKDLPREIEVTVTHFEKPSYQYFKDRRTTLSPSHNIIHITELHDYDSFWFLSVLPQTKGENYKFSVSTTGCFQWNETSRHWEQACVASFGSEFVKCSCSSGSILTGFRSEIKTIPEHQILAIEFELEHKFCWVIFAVTAITFVVFIVMLLYASFEAPYDILDRVFFLSDVPNTYLYVYVLVATTGREKFAGTTSNISIKLHGSNGESLAHLLNYPDPDLMMLQKGTETWFVLATSGCLGDLKALEVWFDAVGHGTKWFCSKFEVHDIQTQESWTFKADRWFDVVHDGNNTFVLTPIKSSKGHLNQKRDQRHKKIHAALEAFLWKFGNEVNLWDFSRTDPTLNRKERSVLIFSLVLSIYLVTMLIYFVPRFDESDTIDQHNFGFDWKLIWTPIAANLVIIIPHFFLVHLIKKGQLNKGRYSQKLAKISWIVVVIIATLSMTALTISGFWVPRDSSLLWLLSIALGLMFNVFVVENVFRMFYGWFLRMPTKTQSLSSLIQRIMKYVEVQRIFIYKRFGALGLRPFLRHLYSALDPITEKERQKWENTKEKVKEILEDLLMITLYIALLYVVLMFDRDDQAVYNNEEVERLLSGKMIGKHVNVNFVKDIESYISDILLPSIQSEHWYGKFVQNNPGMTKDFSNNYLGLIRLRQHRTHGVPCQLPEVMLHLDRTTCRSDFRVFPEKGDYSRGWRPLTDLSNISTERMSNVWRYSKDHVAGTWKQSGEFATYSGGGYVAPLGRNLKNSLVNLKYLQKHQWLDWRTSVLFIEFLIYNPNVNLFNGVTLIFEVNPAGRIVTEFKIQTRKLLMIDKTNIMTRNFVSLLFGLVILVLMTRICKKIARKKKAYFYNVWSILDVIIVLLTFLSMYLYYARLSRIRTYVDTLSTAKNNEFVNYFDLFGADNTLTFMSASLVFVATLRIWKLLRFMVIVKVAEKTIKDASLSLLLCLIYQLLLVVTFSFGGMYLFGGESKDFRNLRTTFTNLLLLSLNLYPNLHLVAFYKRPLGVTFYISFMLVSFFFFNIYIAIISLYYADAKNFYLDDSSSVQKYLVEKWTYYKYLLLTKATKLRGGQDTAKNDLLIIKPKSGERYANCFAIPKERLDAMALVTICVLRNTERQKLMDFELISKTIMALFTKESSRKEMFFPTGDSRRITFVDDRKICQIADICELLANFCVPAHKATRGQHVSAIERRLDRLDTLIDNAKILLRVVNNIKVK
ncbi:polycystin-1-like protein 3 [Euwallacea similis]|uniref:polycystin-1-like protein 3 n=1 Tax=Euwallacea similis TaxID=1736056 RepID=UPI00344B9C8D